jgi:hypothetical protein
VLGFVGRGLIGMIRHRRRTASSFQILKEHSPASFWARAFCLMGTWFKCAAAVGNG